MGTRRGRVHQVWGQSVFERLKIAGVFKAFINDGPPLRTHEFFYTKCSVFQLIYNIRDM